MNDEKNRDNEKKAIKYFVEYLDNRSIPHYFIDQNKDTFSQELKQSDMQRPDFIIHTKIATYYIDVKHRKKNKYKDYRFYLKKSEILRLNNFQDKLNIIILVAFIDVNKNNNFYFSRISELYQYHNDIINNINEKNIIEYFNNENFYFDIPNDLLYNNLSFEFGVFNGFELYKIGEEVDHYRDKFRKITKDANIN